MTTQNDTKPKGTCRHCTKCYVQTGINWQPVYFCTLEPQRVKPVELGDSCSHFEREPGSDDE